VLWDAPLTKDVHVALCLMAVYTTERMTPEEAARQAQMPEGWIF
jgi:hypothetical protein